MLNIRFWEPTDVLEKSPGGISGHWATTGYHFSGHGFLKIVESLHCNIWVLSIGGFDWGDYIILWFSYPPSPAIIMLLFTLLQKCWWGIDEHWLCIREAVHLLMLLYFQWAARRATLFFSIYYKLLLRWCLTSSVEVIGLGNKLSLKEDLGSSQATMSVNDLKKKKMSVN